jgi:hypothetical protein
MQQSVDALKSMLRMAFEAGAKSNHTFDEWFKENWEDVWGD